jgi:hypothetical protein
MVSLGIDATISINTAFICPVFTQIDIRSGYWAIYQGNHSLYSSKTEVKSVKLACDVMHVKLA